jgi:hypothetical protein
MTVIILITHWRLIRAWSGDKKSRDRVGVCEGRKVNLDIVTADVCVLRCFLATKPEADYLRFHARVDTASAIVQQQSTSLRTDISTKRKKKRKTFRGLICSVAFSVIKLAMQTDAVGLRSQNCT